MYSSFSFLFFLFFFSFFFAFSPETWHFLHSWRTNLVSRSRTTIQPGKYWWTWWTYENRDIIIIGSMILKWLIIRMMKWFSFKRWLISSFKQIGRHCLPPKKESVCLHFVATSRWLVTCLAFFTFGQRTCLSWQTFADYFKQLFRVTWVKWLSIEMFVPICVNFARFVYLLHRFPALLIGQEGYPKSLRWCCWWRWLTGSRRYSEVMLSGSISL